MHSILPVALLALGGVLLGGAWSMGKQGASRILVVGFILLAALSVAGGILWLIPK